MKYLFFILLSCTLAVANTHPRTLKIGDLFPEFKLDLMSATSADASAPKNSIIKQSKALSDYLGKPLLLEFWASWCEPCIESLSHFSQMQKQYTGEQLQFLAVNVDEALTKANEFLIKHKFQFLFAVDINGDLARTCRVKVLPMAFLINKEGRVVYISRGYDDFAAKALNAKIKAVLK